jgi:glycosyltransferase involved in cell wall biosynthesis
MPYNADRRIRRRSLRHTFPLRPVRILVPVTWIHPDAPGGSFRVARDLAEALAARGHRVRVLAARWDPAAPVEERAGDLEILRYPPPPKSGPGFHVHTWREIGKRTVENLRTWKPDLVHVHQTVSAFAASRVARAAGVSVVFTCHFPYYLELLEGPAGGDGAGPAARAAAAVFYWMDRMTTRAAARVGCLSEYVAGLVKKLAPEAAGRVRVIPPGIDAARFRSPLTQAEARVRLGLEKDAFLFLTVRRLEGRMGLDRLVAAFADVAEAFPRARMVIGGTGRLLGRLRAAAAVRGAAGRVVFAGRIPEADLPHWYRAADCFVLPTRALEGFGLVLLEAAAAGIPILATPVGGIPEAVRLLPSARLTRDHSREALADGLEDMMRRPPAGPLIDAAQYAVNDRHSPARAAEAYEALFAEALRDA